MTLATVPQAIREMAWNIGYEYPDQAWLLSDYDVWTPNPHYKGPPQPHPEEFAYDDAEVVDWNDEMEADMLRDPLDDIPF